MTRCSDPGVFETFAEAMTACGPFESRPRLAVAVSGGADSMSLALLTKAWLEPRQGSLLALVIDHALRPGSAAEAGLTAARLAALQIPVTRTRLTGLRAGTALAERARAARYEALIGLCAGAGIPHLLLGHHAADQAETVLMRGLRSSGPAGFAAMPLLSEQRTVRLIRPLLAVPPGRLRAMLQQAGVEWVEDPSNTNRAALRPRLRALRADGAGTGPATVALVEAARASGRARALCEAQTARDLAAHAELRPEGFAVLSPGPVPTGVLAALLQAVSGAAYPPSASQLARVADTVAPGTLAGVRIMPAGRLGPGMLLVREAAAMAAPVPASPGRTWDGRFRLSRIGAEFSDPQRSPTIGAVGDDAARLRSWSDLPAAVLRTLPALRQGGGLAAVPHLGYPDPRVCEQVRVVFAPARAAAATPFFSG
jgi:tRNA(Ile)-lysidine synthase